MKKYICQKPCSFGGKKYVIGDEVPAMMLDPSRVKTLIGYGTIAVVEIPDAPVVPQEQTTPPSESTEDSKADDSGDTPSQTTETPEPPAEKPEKPEKKGGRK